jgi:hypothetical protein
MTKQWFLLIPAVVGPIVLLTGAWRGPAQQTAPLAAPSFLVQDVALNHDLIGPEATGVDLLARAIAQLAPARLTWLRTQVWQKMHDARTEFEAEGTLDLAPGQCVRLDLALRSSGGTGRLLIVSDGHALAQVLHLNGAAPEPITELLPEGPGDTPERLQFLETKGCGGPLPLLVGLRRHLQNIRLQTGVLAGHPAIQLKGELGAEVIAAALQTSTPARYAYLYLDARTLWPHRVEWWGTEPRPESSPIVALEFRTPELNQPRDLPECARLFSYP